MAGTDSSFIVDSTNNSAIQMEPSSPYSIFYRASVAAGWTSCTDIEWTRCRQEERMVFVTINSVKSTRKTTPSVHEVQARSHHVFCPKVHAFVLATINCCHSLGTASCDVIYSIIFYQPRAARAAGVNKIWKCEDVNLAATCRKRISSEESGRPPQKNHNLLL